MTEKPLLPEVGRFNGYSLPTRWNGTVFRSRLEARWAIFFDSLNPKLPYHYEAEQIETPFGDYLPDFWLPTIHTFWLVKGEPMDERETKISEWMTEHFGVFVAYGPIPQDFDELIQRSPSYYGASANQAKDGSWYARGDYPMMFCQSWDSGKYGVHWSGCWTRIDGHWDGDYCADQPTPNVLRALEIARNHRFDKRN